MIQEQINNDILAAMRSQDGGKLTVLRSLKSALSNCALQGGNINRSLPDLEVLGIVRKQIKQREDSIEFFKKDNRVELEAKERAEIAVLDTYLPKALSDLEIDGIVADAIQSVGATTKKQMGQVMKIALETANGRVDNKTLSAKIGAKLV